MPTKKIASFDHAESRPCPSPEHGPPSLRVFSPGIYEHTCPLCGYVTRFVVPVWPQLAAGGGSCA